MIFVTVGTHEQPFDRLIKEVDRLKAEEIIEEDIFIQCGYSLYKPKMCDSKTFLDFDEMQEKMESARIVITHGGSSSIMQALALGKILIVVPRQKRFGEHVDDHQVSFVKRLEEKKMVVGVYNIEDLGKALLNYRAVISDFNLSSDIAGHFQQNIESFARRLDEAIQKLWHGFLF